jgi:hypothetical protein
MRSSNILLILLRACFFFDKLSLDFRLLNNVVDLYQRLLPASFDLFIELYIFSRIMVEFNYLEGNDEWNKI